MSNADLIAKARKFAVYFDGGGPKGLLGQVLDALEVSERERDEYMERFRNVSDANSDILDQLWAAQSVIAEAKRSLDYGGERHYLERIYATQNALSQSPTDALQAHDRQVAAKAVRVELLRMADVAEGSAAWTENNFLPGPNSDYAIRHEREMAVWLRDSAAAIVSEPSTPEQPEGENR